MYSDRSRQGMAIDDQVTPISASSLSPSMTAETSGRTPLCMVRPKGVMQTSNGRVRPISAARSLASWIFSFKWSTETISTYVYKRAFDWNTFDLGYPSAIAVLWFLIILAFILLLGRLLRQRDKLEF